MAWVTDDAVKDVDLGPTLELGEVFVSIGGEHARFEEVYVSGVRVLLRQDAGPRRATADP